ncbi:hypothetical protein [Pseudomonas fluorescens]|uniref:Uncharacterized protein n=1 Tax=Pseudomonas fluorescens TaxID=294 RepID=A0A5E7E808_PSEFL|nr:hypothetical protein [Pseudomonas fluorescens]VVO22890.1 hypothetical protein PS723_04359 [Pseudomonas fluorescens]
MTTPARTAEKIAADAIATLGCVRNQLEIFGAQFRAIKDAAVEDASLLAILGATSACDWENHLDAEESRLREELAEFEAATQNAVSEIVSRTSTEGRP